MRAMTTTTQDINIHPARITVPTDWHSVYKELNLASVAAALKLALNPVKKGGGLDLKLVRDKEIEPVDLLHHRMHARKQEHGETSDHGSRNNHKRQEEQQEAKALGHSEK